MVWARGDNERVMTKVSGGRVQSRHRLDGWDEGGLGQQLDEGEGCRLWYIK